MPNGIEIALNGCMEPEDPTRMEDKGRGAWIGA